MDDDGLLCLNEINKRVPNIGTTEISWNVRNSESPWNVLIYTIGNLQND